MAIDMIFHKGRARGDIQYRRDNEWKNIDLIRKLIEIVDMELEEPGTSQRLITL